MVKEEGYFKEAIILARHIKYKEPNIPPLRLQKTLYFLFAFYGNIFGEEEGYPEYLFNEDFEAWKFGANLKSIYEGNKEGKVYKEEYIAKDGKDEQVLSMIEEATISINNLGDFELVERNQQDQAWKNAKKVNDVYGLMDKDEIIKGYNSLKKGR